MADQRGQAVVLVMVITVIVLAAGSGVLALGLAVSRNAAAEVVQQKAYYISAAGINQALALIGDDPETFEKMGSGSPVQLVPAPVPAAYGGGLLDHVSVSRIGKGEEISLLVESEGRYLQGRSVLQAKVELTPGTAPQTTCWKELHE